MASLRRQSKIQVLRMSVVLFRCSVPFSMSCHTSSTNIVVVKLSCGRYTDISVHKLYLAGGRRIYPRSGFTIRLEKNYFLNNILNFLDLELVCKATLFWRLDIL